MGSNIDTNYFDEHWKSLDPAYANLLTKADQFHDYDSRSLWLKLAETSVLPFHSFESGHEFRIRFSKKLPDYTLSFLWEVFYQTSGAGTPFSYAIDLLTNKQTIYKQGESLKEFVEIKSINSGQNDDNDTFEKLLKNNLSITAILDIDRRQKAKEILNGSLCSVSTSFFRFNETAIQKDEKTISARVSLGHYWLDWVETALRAGFDFNYLSGLKPLEMRFYELTQLLRFRDRSTNIDKLREVPLEISYNELCNLMPLPKLKIPTDIEAQIRELCRCHKKSKYLKSYSLSQIHKKNVFTDVIIKFNFYSNKNLLA